MIEATMMKGVLITTLKIISDERGSVMKMMDNLTPIMKTPRHDNVSEIYFSTINPGIVKAWHGHKIMTLNYACIYGRIIVGLCDTRVGDTFGEVAMVYLDTLDQYKLLTIPPGVWNGFRTHSNHNEMAIIANAASHIHSPDEIMRIHPNKFPCKFDWGEYEIAG
jgi:dTDP-4-dehydrorhamnose 3,5-epimerase